MQFKSIPVLTRLKQFLSGLLLTVSTLILSLWIAWQVAAIGDFGYRIGYQLLGIEQHIKTYGPMNRFKRDFQFTEPNQHKALFSDIVHAIQHGGDGLESITYQTQAGKRHLLLRAPEIVHLQDVANLIGVGNWITAVSAVIFMGMLFYYRLKTRSPPNVKQIAIGSVITLALLAILLFSVGPTATFYWLHTQIFPDNHQWFFYYQESLMTTLMKAPDLFAFIAIVWGGIAVVTFAILQFASRKLIRHQTGRPSLSSE